jgi:hypothetical protein
MILETQEQKPATYKTPSKEKPKLYAVTSGYLNIAGRKIPVAVLNNRKRVLIQREVVGLMSW